MTILGVRTGTVRSVLIFKTLFPMVLGATAVQIYGLAVGLRAPVIVILMILGAAGVGILTFSILTMRRDGQSLDETIRPYPASPAGVDLEALRNAERLDPPGEPYPHHEDYVESPGDTFAELTTRVAGDTPFLENLYRRKRK